MTEEGQDWHPCMATLQFYTVSMRGPSAIKGLTDSSRCGSRLVKGKATAGLHSSRVDLGFKFCNCNFRQCGPLTEAALEVRGDREELLWAQFSLKAGSNARGKTSGLNWFGGMNWYAVFSLPAGASFQTFGEASKGPSDGLITMLALTMAQGTWAEAHWVSLRRRQGGEKQM